MARNLFRFRGGGGFLRTRGFATFDRTIFSRNWSRINESPSKRAGLLARKIWRQSIRKDRSISQRPSKPGKPPKSRAPGHPFKQIFSLPINNILGVSAGAIVGHVGFRPGSQTAMEAQEWGKTVKINGILQTRSRNKLKTRQQKANARAAFRSGKAKHRKRARARMQVKLPERPHARPALQKAKDKLPALWRNSVTHARVKS